MLCWSLRMKSFFHSCNKLLFYRSLLHVAFSCHFVTNIPFHKTRLLAPKLLNFKLPSIVQKIFARASILLHNMRHQAQVTLDKNISGIQVTPGCQFQIVSFFLGCQWLGKAPGGQLQRTKQRTEHQPYGCQHTRHLRCKFIPHCPSSFPNVCGGSATEQNVSFLFVFLPIESAVQICVRVGHHPAGAPQKFQFFLLLISSV